MLILQALSKQTGPVLFFAQRAGQKPNTSLPLCRHSRSENSSLAFKFGLLFHRCYRTFNPYFCVAGGTMPFMRRYSTSWP